MIHYLLLVLTSFFCVKNIDGALPVYLDSSFGPYQNGTVITQIDSQSKANGIALQENQYILAAGYASTGQALARYDQQGNLDPKFGKEGVIVVPFGKDSTIYSLAIQPDSKIITAGITTVERAATLTLIRYTPNGFPDESFGSGGVALLSLGEGTGAYSLDIQNLKDRVLVAGAAVIEGSSVILLAEFNSEGILEKSFGTSGFVTDSVGYTSAAHAVKIQNDGRILVAGTTSSSTGPVLFLSRYTPDGSLDASFGSKGVTITSAPGATATTATALSLQSDGKIIVAGTATSNNITSGILARYTTEGLLDEKFGTNGMRLIDVDSTQAVELTSLKIASDNSIVTSGSISGMRDVEAFIIKLTAEGDFDSSFGKNGMLTIATPAGSAGSALEIQADGKYVFAGAITSYEKCTPHFLVARAFNSNQPFITIENPAQNALINTAQIALEGISNYAQATVYLTLNDVRLAPLTTSTTGSWNFKLSPLLVNGANSLNAELYDGDNLLATATTLFKVATADNIVIDYPTNSGTVKTNVLTISGGSTEAGQTVNIYVDNLLVKSSATSLAGTWTTYSSPALTNGEHIILAELYDGKNLVATNTISITIDGQNTIFVTTPAKGSTLTTSTTPLVGTSSGNNLGVNIFIDGAYFTTLTTSNTGNWDGGMSPKLTNGKHIILAQLTNNLGEVLATVASNFFVSI